MDDIPLCTTGDRRQSIGARYSLAVSPPNLSRDINATRVSVLGCQPRRRPWLWAQVWRLRKQAAVRSCRICAMWYWKT